MSLVVIPGCPLRLICESPLQFSTRHLQYATSNTLFSSFHTYLFTLSVLWKSGNVPDRAREPVMTYEWLSVLLHPWALFSSGIFAYCRCSSILETSRQMTFGDSTTHLPALLQTLALLSVVLIISFGSSGWPVHFGWSDTLIIIFFVNFLHIRRPWIFLFAEGAKGDAQHKEVVSNLWFVCPEFFQSSKGTSV